MMTPSEDTVAPAHYPELVFGLVGPIGVDMNSVQDALREALKAVDYTGHVIHLTNLINESFPNWSSNISADSDSEQKIAAVNQLRKDSGRMDVMAGLAILHIRNLRAHINRNCGVSDVDLFRVPAQRHAFIVRQLKRAEEVELLRDVYGKKFIQISVSLDSRVQYNAVAQNQPLTLEPSERDAKVRSLIETDASELSDHFGQRQSEAYQRGDVFIPGESMSEIRAGMNRFIDALFGSNSTSPTIDEIGSYLAKAASLRSIDLSRQVGSAILSRVGDVISLGCNEVPRPMGGNYRVEDDFPQRDFERGIDANKLEIDRIIGNFLASLHKLGVINEQPDQLLDNKDVRAAIKKTLVSDITEFGRITHAEMSALMDAARLGRAVQDATMYVTTFPCHNCAKHIIASGIARIVYIEPYEKSKALQQHDDALSMTAEKGKVLVEHFRGISPRRFRDIFEKVRRKDSAGKPRVRMH